LRAGHAIQQYGQFRLAVRTRFGENRLEVPTRRLTGYAKKVGDLGELLTARDGFRQPDLGGRQGEQFPKQKIVGLHAAVEVADDQNCGRLLEQIARRVHQWRALHDKRSARSLRDRDGVKGGRLVWRLVGMLAKIAFASSLSIIEREDLVEGTVGDLLLSAAMDYADIHGPKEART
jgi:hypothetical protein